MAITNYEYEVVKIPTMLLIGKETEKGIQYEDEIEGFNVNLVRYEIHDDGDRVIDSSGSITLTGLTKDEEGQFEMIKNMIINTCCMFGQHVTDISRFDFHKMFRKDN
jgi:tRNA G10  N-methylase Trm11